MRVLVTGGTGSVGKETTRHLVGKGWAVRVVGRRAGIEIPGAEYAVCDVLSFDAVRDCVRGCDAVVHLAAIASPSRSPGQEVFASNALGTFHVFEAAAKEGIGRVVHASSINAFGCFWSLGDLRVEYLPVDEEHPTWTTDAYSFSKTVVEEIGRYYWRREGIASLALRLPWVRPQKVLADDRYRQRLHRTRQMLDELRALPEGQRASRLAEVRRRALEFRSRRALEHGAERDARRKKGPAGEDPLFGVYMSERFNFWAVVDERDAAQAVEKGLTADFDGGEVLFINDDHNWLDYDAEALAGLFFPHVERRKKPLTGSASLVSVDKARELIGFQPEHSMAGFLQDGSGNGPPG